MRRNQVSAMVFVQVCAIFFWRGRKQIPQMVVFESLNVKQKVPKRWPELSLENWGGSKLDQQPLSHLSFA